MVNEAGYSGDPGGITTHSDLISRKAAWNPTLSDLMNVLAPPPLCRLSRPVFWD